MSQAGYTPIQLYYSTTAAAVPTAGNLASGELALNIADMKLYAKNSSNVVTLLASAAGASPGGSNTQIQYNNSGAFGGSSNLTWDGTNFRTAGNARIEGTGVGLTGTGAGAEIFANSGNVYFQAYNRTTSAYAPVIISGSEVIFTTAGFERMRIDSSGNVGIGTSSPSALGGGGLTLGTTSAGKNLIMYSSSDGNNGLIQFIDLNAANAFQINGNSANIGLYGYGSRPMIFYTNGTERMRISAAGGFSVGTTADPGAGAIYATGAITAYYSDARLKDVKGTITNALDKVSSLSGVYYTNNEVAVAHGYTSAEIQVGLLAQDVEAVLPEVVKAAPFDLDEKGNSKSGEHYKTIQYERVIPLLVEAIKELRAEIQVLRG